jgi:anaphase-promoting complex subunit 2
MAFFSTSPSVLSSSHSAYSIDDISVKDTSDIDKNDFKTSAAIREAANHFCKQILSSSSSLQHTKQSHEPLLVVANSIIQLASLIDDEQEQNTKRQRRMVSALTANVFASSLEKETTSKESSSSRNSTRTVTAWEELRRSILSLLTMTLVRRDSKNDTDDDDDDDADEEEWYLSSQLEAEFFAALKKLRWLETLFAHEWNLVIQTTMFRSIQSTIAGNYEEPLFPRILEWTRQVIGSWIRDTTDGGSSASCAKSNDENNDREHDWIYQCASESFCLVRMEELFDIITSFPESATAVHELRDVLMRTTHYHHLLARHLRDTLIRRLNHPGADTTQIIDVYINTIKVLEILDTTRKITTTTAAAAASMGGGDRHGVMLRLVAEPVREYLRSRSDTVRCIITSLTTGDLYQELRRQDAKLLENVTVDSDDEEECPDLSWEPPPSLLQPRLREYGNQPISSSGSQSNTGNNNLQQQQQGQYSSDILAMLVSIYGSKELFVNEYRIMLADKLLANLDYNTDKEVHTLELLKLRFGEISMNSAEIMIKDMNDSVRTNKNIQEYLQKRMKQPSTTTSSNHNHVDAAIVSHIFWPTLSLPNESSSSLKLHPRIQAELDEYGAAYAELKNPRKLNWMHALGTVQLELDIQEERSGDNDDGKISHVETKTFTCSPLLATLISHFEDKPTWTAEELSNETGIPEHVIQKRMAFWIANHVVVFDTSKTNQKSIAYTLASFKQRKQSENDQKQHQHLSGGSQMGGMAMMMEDDDDPHHSSVSAADLAHRDQEEMELYESYVMVMLSSLQQANLEKIHNTLKMMLASAGGDATKSNTITPQQLNVFLQRLCRQEKLECGPDGMYKIFKK